MQNFKFVKSGNGAGMTFMSEEMDLRLVTVLTIRVPDQNTRDMLDILYGLKDNKWRDISDTKYNENVDSVKLFYPKEYNKLVSGGYNWGKEVRSIKVLPSAARALYD